MIFRNILQALEPPGRVVQLGDDLDFKHLYPDYIYIYIYVYMYIYIYIYIYNALFVSYTTYIYI